VRRIASTATVKNEGTQQEVTNFEVHVQIVDPKERLRPGGERGPDDNIVLIPIIPPVTLDRKG
jgi:hypothetical protein